MGDWTGTIPSFVAGGRAEAPDIAELAAVATALTDDWSTWTPTLTNLTVGSTALVSRYRRLKYTVDFQLIFVYSSGAAVGSTPGFTLPVAPSASYPTASGSVLPFHVTLVDAATTQRQGFAAWNGTRVDLLWWNAGVPASVTSSSPWTWTTNDQMHVHGSYRAA